MRRTYYYIPVERSFQYQKRAKNRDDGLKLANKHAPPPKVDMAHHTAKHIASIVNDVGILRL